MYGRRRGGVYVCSAARRKGRAVCASALHLSIVETESAILDAVERDLLDADVFRDALEVAVRRVAERASHQGALIHERQRLEKELANLTSAVAAGGELPVLLAEIQKRQTRLIEVTRLSGSAGPDTRELRESFGKRLRDWKALLRGRPIQGQQVLKVLLRGQIQISAPLDDVVEWSATADMRGILATLSTRVASPAGFEPALPA